MVRRAAGPRAISLQHKNTHHLVVAALHRLKLRNLIQLFLLDVDEQPVCDALAQRVDARQSSLEARNAVVGEVAVLSRLLVEELQCVLVCHPVELRDAWHDASVQHANAVGKQAALLAVQRCQHLHD